MLVDLERNDLGRVSRYGTVHVDELMVIEKYSHVQHIVSNVRGEVAPEHSGSQVLAAMFPGGTITGAPKIRTMEIIEELEPVRRGIYTGSLGFISWADDVIFNILIRTLVEKDWMAYVQAGAGVVTDSDAAREYEESLSKAKALWVTKETAEETR
jgi:para-aminobenzoate synthetase component 1